MFYLNFICRNLLIPALCLSSIIYGEEPQVALNKINNNWNLINNAAESFQINPKYLAAIIYVERILNYDWEDEAFDLLFAKYGINSSIGFGQIKIKTAYWIEAALNDSNSEFYFNNNSNLIYLSSNPSEIITKLSDDSTNILYAAAYLGIIQNYWNKKGHSIDDKPEIIGTLYSTGFYHKDGRMRRPNSNPKPNEFGKSVKKSLELF